MTYEEYLEQHNAGEQLIKEAQQELEKAQDESKKADGEVSKFVERDMQNLGKPQRDKDYYEVERLYGEQKSAHSKEERMEQHLDICNQLLEGLESRNPEFTERLKDNPEDAAKVDQQEGLSGKEIGFAMQTFLTTGLALIGTVHNSLAEFREAFLDAAQQSPRIEQTENKLPEDLPKRNEQEVGTGPRTNMEIVSPPPPPPPPPPEESSSMKK